MAGTIDLGRVSVDTKSAKRDIEGLSDKLDELVGKVKETNKAYAGLGKQDAKDALGALKTGALGAVAAYVALGVAITSAAVSAERSQVAIRGLGTGLASIQAATNGAMSAQVAFAAQNQITQSGLRISGDQLAIVARAAREFALRTGTDSAQAMQQLTAAIVSGDAQALRPFGVSVMQGTLRTQALRQALTQLSSQQQSSIAPARTLAEETERLSRSWDVFKESMAASAANALDLKTAISDMGTVLEDFARGGNLAADALNHLSQEWLGVNAVSRRQNQQGAAIEARNRISQSIRGQQQYNSRAGLPAVNIGFNPNNLSEADAIAMDAELNPGFLGTNARAQTPQDVQAIVNRYASRVSQSVSARSAAVVAGARVRPGGVAGGGTSDTAERLRPMSALDRAALAEDQRNARQQLSVLISDMQQMGYRFDPRFRSQMEGLIRGFLDPANKQRFEQAMQRQGRTVTNEQRLRGLDQDSRRMGLVEYQEGNSGRAEFDTSREYLSGMTVDGRDSVGSRYGFGLSNAQYAAILASEREKSGAAFEQSEAIERGGRFGRRIAGDNALLGGNSTESLIARFGGNLGADSYAQLAEAEQGKAGARAEMGQTVAGLARRNNLSEQMGSFFSDTQTLAEKGAKGVEGAFNTMSGAVSGFIDTLIEGQVPAGEAAVGLAKAALKGLAMQAIPESLFETAKGFAALAVGNPMAATHFTAAGIFAGVAIAAGAGAAGIGAAQRGSQRSASASAAGPMGSSLPSGGGGSRDTRPIVINVNGTVMDKEGFANAVLDGVNDAVGRGGRLGS